MGVPAVYGQLRRLKLSANWVLMVAFDEPLALPWTLEGAFVQGSEVLSWAGNNTAKLGLSPNGPQCWTLISTQQYGKANKVPQEAVPPEKATQVVADMLTAFQQSLGISKLPSHCFTRVQLWGAALPINTPRVPCIWDAERRVGVAGDWVSGGGSMQSAALSGAAMAERIAATRGMDMISAAGLNIGLSDKLMPVQGQDIGVFPS